MNEIGSPLDCDFSEGSCVVSEDVVPREPSFPARYLRFGTFELDLKGQRLFRDGASILIYGKVYATLLALLENPGEIVTRELLQSRLWPGKTGIDRRSNLNTTVNKLRRLLQDTDPGHPVIATIVRKGYLFTAKIEYAHQSINENRRQKMTEQKASRISWTRVAAALYTNSRTIGFRTSLIVLLAASILLGAAMALYAHRPFYQP